MVIEIDSVNIVICLRYIFNEYIIIFNDLYIIIVIGGISVIVLILKIVVSVKLIKVILVYIFIFCWLKLFFFFIFWFSLKSIIFNIRIKLVVKIEIKNDIL